MLKRRGWTFETAALLMPAVVFLLVVFVYPFIYALKLSFTAKDSGMLTLANYIRFFTDSVEMKTVWNTILISVPVTILTIALAIPIAYYMRNGIRHEKLVTFF